MSNPRYPSLYQINTRVWLTELSRALGKRATLVTVADGDHSFHVPARTGRSDEDVKTEMLDAFAGWIEAAIS